MSRHNRERRKFRRYRAGTHFDHTGAPSAGPSPTLYHAARLGRHGAEICGEVVKRGLILPSVEELKQKKKIKKEEWSRTDISGSPMTTLGQAMGKS